MSTNIFKSNQHFAMNPVSVDLPRSTFDRSNTHKTTFDSGKLIPIFLEEVLPGDTFNIEYSYLIRMSTPLYPVMDTANLDIYFFFVPTRIIWSDFQKFMGENDNAWTDNQQEIFVPQVFSSGSSGSVFYTESDLAGYLGVPVRKTILNNNAGLTINALPFRAYCKIWNDWFRDQNTQKTIFYNTNSANVDMKNYTSTYNSTSFLTNLQYGRDLAPVNKYNDYFTSCLPGPQKGDPVSIGLAGTAPISISNTNANVIYPNISQRSVVGDSNGQNLFLPRFWSSAGDEILSSESGSGNYWMLSIGDIGGHSELSVRKIATSGSISNATSAKIGLQADITNQVNGSYANITNLKGTADLSKASAITVNELRQAFQIQKLLERDARGGTRYIEIIRSHFGVISPDARLQRSEYLGGNRQPINIEQVLQTSAGTGTSPLGQTGAFSMTTSKENGFTKSFTEHGYIMGVCCVRVEHSYGQGINKLWSRKRKYDYYWPALANIGEQPVFKREIFFTSNNISTNEQVFGYNEAWADYRYKLNQVSGQFSPNSTQSLLSWTYTDNYNNAPTLGNDWIQEGQSNIAQTLALQNFPQFIADFYFSNLATRAMPVYSIPGLIDHN